MDEVGNVKKNTKKGVLIGGILILILLLIGIVTYLLLSVKPKKVFTTAIDKVYNLSKENNQDTEKVSGKFTITTDIHSDEVEVEKILEIVNKLNISMDMGVDAKSKKMHMALDSLYNNKELINASIDILDSNAYVYLNDIYDKSLLVPIEGMDEMFSLMENVKDYEIVLKQFKNALDKALKDEYFTKDNTTITLNGKKVKVIENKLTLNEKNIKEIASILSEELNNDEFIESFSRISATTKEEVKEMLNEMKQEISLEDGTLFVSIYTKGIKNEFAGISIKDNKDVISLLKNTDTNYSYEIKIENENYKGDIEVKTKGKDGHLKISFDIEKIHGSVTFDFVNNKEVNLPNVDTSNAISIENLSETDSMNILNNLQKKEGIVEIIQAFTSNISNLSF